MAKNSTYGQLHGQEVRDACLKIIGNAGHITLEDLKSLQFMATKGDFEKKRVKLVPSK